MIVIGAGPAGSFAAHRLAEQGAAVLLLDRARFPREKPCGGGVTVRALRLLPFALDPVVEQVVARLELRFRYGPRFERIRAKPLAVMTQRSRLDGFLVERAATAGADFRDGLRVTEVMADQLGAEVRVGGRVLRAEAVIGADGVNGITARSLDLCKRPAYGVALEGNVPFELVDAERYRGRIVFELGVVRGGYGWVFPKGGHVNVGVGGWEREARSLRRHLTRLCREHGIPDERLESVRGYRLPVSRPGAVLVRGRGLLVGDAAGLVDPLTGDGIYEAFQSAKLAADETAVLLAGRGHDLEGYNLRLRRVLGRQLSNAWAAKVALECFPRLMFNVARTEVVQRGLERLGRGESGGGGVGVLPRVPLEVLGWPARAVGDAGHASRREAPSGSGDLREQRRRLKLPRGMRTVSFERFAELASFLVVLGSLLYSVFFIWVVEGGGSNVRAVWYFLLMLGGLGTVPVFVALYQLLRETEPGFALTAFLLGMGATLGAVLHGSYNLGVEITPPERLVLGQEDVARGALRYLVLGLFFLLTAWLIQRGGALPLGLAYLGYLGGAILVFIYIGRLFDFIVPSNYVSLIPPIVYGFVVHPLWYLWLGLTLWRGIPEVPPSAAGEPVGGRM